MPLSGYAIVLRSEYEIERYLRLEFIQPHLHHIESLRAAVCFLDPKRYRGTGRSWIMPLPSLDPAVVADFERAGCDIQSEKRARHRFRKLIGEDVDPEDDDLFRAVHHAREIFSLLDNPTHYEIIELHRRDFSVSDSLLGYDIGYWNGDHFSLIADSFVTPTWHPPQPEIFGMLAEQLRILNDHLLFPTAEGAGAFGRWYRLQYWAEKELYKEQFEIIQVVEPHAANAQTPDSGIVSEKSSATPRSRSA